MSKEKHKTEYPFSDNGVAGSVLGRYQDAFVLKTIYCNNCKTIITPNGMMLSFSIVDLIKRAEAEHKAGVEKGDMLCSKRQLIITSENVLVSKAAIESGEILHG